MYRNPEHIIVATPMILFLLYLVQRFIRTQFWNFFTLGLFGIGERQLKKEKRESKVFANPVLVPFVWHFIATLAVVILFANIDVSYFLFSEFFRSSHEWLVQAHCTIGLLPISLMSINQENNPAVQSS